ncbi:unnamed protein product [Brassica oleracea]
MKSSSTPWRSPIRHGSVMMMPSTPLAWRLIQLNSHSKKTMMTSSKCLYIGEAELKTSVKTCDKNLLLRLDTSRLLGLH